MEACHNLVLHGFKVIFHTSELKLQIWSKNDIKLDFHCSKKEPINIAGCHRSGGDEVRKLPVMPHSDKAWCSCLTVPTERIEINKKSFIRTGQVCFQQRTMIYKYDA